MYKAHLKIPAVSQSAVMSDKTSNIVTAYTFVCKFLSGVMIKSSNLEYPLSNSFCSVFLC